MAKCSAKNCSVKNANYAYSKTDKSKYCAKHKVPGMVDIKHSTCNTDECRKRPNFNFLGQTKGVKCFKHKVDGMVDVINATCEKDNCNKQPSFNFQGQKRGIRCYNHTVNGMVDVINKRCEAKNCNKQPSFNFPNQTRRVRCEKHSLPGMLNVADKRCVSCGLFQVTKSKDYMCHQCFMFNNPNHESSRHYKTKELTFTRLLQQDLSTQGIECVLDSKISGGCSRRRPDVFIDMLTHVLIIEIDENQHLSYNESCEYVRTIELNEDIGHRPMYIIRLNPDSYKLNGKSYRGCFTSKMELNKKEFGHRYSTLLSTVLDLTATPPERLIESIELFFTESD